MEQYNLIHEHCPSVMPTPQREHLLLGQACEVLRRSYEKGWISTRDGNVSVGSVEPGVFFVSHRVMPEHFVEVREATRLDELSKRGHRPSGEIDLHRGLHALLPAGHTSVLHVHATHIVAALYAGHDLRELASGFPEVARYTRVGANVPALAATSLELAAATLRAFQNRGGEMPHIVGLDRHGVVTIGRDPWDAFEHVERLEHICQIVLAAGRPAIVERDLVAGPGTAS
jgi:ribulose-5-phosphate 4-epimerase/fuculose-1-phosphate aldolase